MSILPIDGFIPANGLQLHYRRWSPEEPRGDLPPTLLLHGLASAARIWDFVASQLVNRGYVITALDQRGPANPYEHAASRARAHSRATSQYPYCVHA